MSPAGNQSGASKPPSSTPAAAGAPSSGRPEPPRAGSFLDDTLPRRGSGLSHAMAFPDHDARAAFPGTFPKARIANGAMRDLHRATHLGDGVATHIFNETNAKKTTEIKSAAGKPSATPSLRDHPSYRGAAGVPSDCSIAQAHPDLPGVSGTPRVLPGHKAAMQIGQHAEAFLAKREAVLTPRKQAASAAEATPAVPDISDFVPNTVQPATTFPWEMASNVAPDQPAPPKEYAAENASLPERARFRGVRKVDTPLAGESQPRELGGVLNQSNFPEAAPKRWDDKLFETRLYAKLAPPPMSTKAARSAFRAASKGPTTPRGGGGKR